MAQIIDGKLVSGQVRERVARKLRSLRKRALHRVLQ